MSYRIYGRAGQKVVTGVVSDQVGGDQGFIPDDQNFGNGSTVGLQHLSNQDKMNTGVEIRKPTDNIIS